MRLTSHTYVGRSANVKAYCPPSPYIARTPHTDTINCKCKEKKAQNANSVLSTEADCVVEITSI